MLLLRLLLLHCGLFRKIRLPVNPHTANPHKSGFGKPDSHNLFVGNQIIQKIWFFDNRLPETSLRIGLSKALSISAAILVQLHKSENLVSGPGSLVVKFPKLNLHLHLNLKCTKSAKRNFSWTFCAFWYTVKWGLKSKFKFNCNFFHRFIRHVKNLVNLQNASSISEIWRLMNLARVGRREPYCFTMLLSGEEDVLFSLCWSFQKNAVVLLIYEGGGKILGENLSLGQVH